MSDKMTAALHQACQMFMYPVAKFLLQHGFRFNDFADAARIAFVQAAEDDEQAVSRIASKTGIPRKDVARCKEEPRINVNSLIQNLLRPAEIVGIWHRDADFRDQKGEPRVLEERGELGFEGLCRRANPPSAYRDVLDDLIASEVVERLADGKIRVIQRYFIPNESRPERRVFQFALHLRDLAATMYRNAQVKTSDDKSVEAVAHNILIDRAQLPAIKDMARRQTMGMLANFDDWLMAQSNPLTGKNARAGVGVYFFEDTGIEKLT